MSESTPNGFRYRLENLERRVSDIEQEARRVIVIEERLSGIQREISALRQTLDDDVKGLRRVFISFGIGIVSAAVIFALTVSQLLIS